MSRGLMLGWYGQLCMHVCMCVCVCVLFVDLHELNICSVTQVYQTCPNRPPTAQRGTQRSAQPTKKEREKERVRSLKKTKADGKKRREKKCRSQRKLLLFVESKEISLNEISIKTGIHGGTQAMGQERREVFAARGRRGWRGSGLGYRQGVTTRWKSAWAGSPVRSSSPRSRCSVNTAIPQRKLGFRAQDTDHCTTNTQLTPKRKAFYCSDVAFS